MENAVVASFPLEKSGTLFSQVFEFEALGIRDYNGNRKPVVMLRGGEYLGGRWIPRTKRRNGTNDFELGVRRYYSCHL